MFILLTNIDSNLIIVRFLTDGWVSNVNALFKIIYAANL